MYFNMLNLDIDTVLIDYKNDGAKSKIEEVIKYIISD